jgi:hypothetical protein
MLSGMKVGTVSKSGKPARRKIGRVLPAGRPHIAVESGLLGQEHVVIRQSDDTDADHEARRRLLDAALGFARKG